VALPPSDATLLAALPAPPGTISVESYSRIRTGASRDTRATRPYTNSSATTSPMNGDGPAPQRADKGEELRRIHPTASIRLLRIASGSRRPGGASLPPELCPDSHEHRPHAGGVPARHVDRPVAHHERPRQIEPKIRGGLLDHSRPRLAAAAHHAVLGQRRVGMMRTEVVAIDARTRLRRGADRTRRARSAGTARSMIPRPIGGLIGHHDHREAGRD
jgi:hypothetical protein